MATVTMQSLRKSYGDVEVLKGVDVQIADGEYLVLVGPSGCGKSTLLRTLAGLEDITSGTLSIGERVVNDVAPKDRNIAMVFQSYALYPHMTVRQNMGFALKIRKVPPAEIDSAVNEVARQLELSHLLDRLPGQLSGGQRQRVAMGRAIVRRPDVFLFDEPLSNLDAALRTHMRVELKRLHQRLGATVVHVTHDQVEALTLADRILVLDKGIVQQVGTPTELFETPANAFVAGFIGSPAMNFLPATPHPDGGARVGELVLPVPVAHACTLGIRPNDVRVVDDGVPFVVEVVESLGWEGHAHGTLGGEPFVVRVSPPEQVSVGATVGLAFDRVHRFDADSGARLP